MNSSNTENDELQKKYNTVKKKYNTVKKKIQYSEKKNTIQWKKIQYSEKKYNTVKKKTKTKQYIRKSTSKNKKLEADPKIVTSNFFPYKSLKQKQSKSQYLCGWPVENTWDIT